MPEGVEGRFIHVLFEFGFSFESEGFGRLLGIFPFVLELTVRVACGVVEEGLGVFVAFAVAINGGDCDLALSVVSPHRE